MYFRALAPLLWHLLLPERVQVLKLVDRALGKLVQRVVRLFGAQVKLGGLEGAAEGRSRCMSMCAFAALLRGVKALPSWDAELFFKSSNGIGIISPSTMSMSLSFLISDSYFSSVCVSQNSAKLKAFELTGSS